VIVPVRLAGPLAQAVGMPRVSVVLERGATVRDLRERLAAEQPALEESLSSALVVIHGSSASPRDPVPPDEEVALLLPVAGGATQRRTDGH